MRRALSIADAVPMGWLDHLTEGGRLAGGFDVATTANKLSNPSSLAIVEEAAMMFYCRLLLRWKTADPEVAKALLRHVLTLLRLRRRRLVKLCVDATSEKYFATDIRRDLAGIVPVELVVFSLNTIYRGEKMPMKSYLGNLYVNTIDDGRMALPDEKWVSDDARQVVRNKGSFEAAVDKVGNHADAFTSTELALHGLSGQGSGPAEASATPLGSMGKAPSRWRNPLAHLFEKGGTIHA